MSRWRRLGLHLGLDVHPGELRQSALLFVSFFLVTGFQYATKSVRQATFVDALGAERLPFVYLAVALCSYPLLRLYLRTAERFAHHHLVAGTSVLVALTMAVFWWLFRMQTLWVPGLFYVWLSFTYALLLSQFWHLAGRVYDARQAKRLFGLIGAGALLGGVAGGQIARLSSQAAGTRATLLVAAGLLLLAAAPVVALRPRAAASEPEAAPSGGGFSVVRGSRHLSWTMVMLVVGVVVGQVIDLQFNWAVQEATSGLDERSAYFGNLYSVFGLSAFAFQLLMTSRIHRTMGVGFALRILPVVLALGTAGLLGAAAILPALVFQVAVGLKITDNGLRFSLDDASRELLFLPLPESTRVKAKAFIDVVAKRAAKGLAALLLLPVAFGLLTPVQAGWASLLLIVLWLLTTRRVHREYLRSFRRSLSTQAVDSAVPIRVSDATTLELLVQSLGSPDARQVLHSLEVLSSHGRGNLVMPLLLLHDDADVRYRTLEIMAAEGRTDAAPLVERRLSDPEPEVRALAIRVLARLSGRDVVELMLPRLEDPNPGVRAAAVVGLITHGQEELRDRATQVLQDLLLDEEAAVRAEAARALSGIADPLYQEDVVRLLYDSDAGVAREAIRAVHQRISAGGGNPLYLPTLVSLLHERRLKHDARRALVAFGEPAIPALVHFLSEPGENLWVKRALPKALAQIGTRGAAEALVQCLREDPDAFVRRKIIEALGSLEIALPSSCAPQVGEQVRAEIHGYLAALRDLDSLGLAAKTEMAGPMPVWADGQRDPSLLEKLLLECLSDHVQNIFGLLALEAPAEHIWAAHRGLLAPRRATRGHALEYLDNSLPAEVRRDLFVVIDDMPLADKLTAARERFGIHQRSALETLSHMMKHCDDDERASHLAVAAIYAAYCDRLTGLYPMLRSLCSGAADKFVAETAGWAASRIGLDGANL